MTRDPRQAAWIVVYAPLKQRCAIPADARLVYEVSVQGALLTRVYQR